MRHAIDYDRAFELWEETEAESQYDSDLSDGILPATRFTIDGIAIDPQPFEEWITSARADVLFEGWIEDQYEAAMDARAEALRDERMGL